VHPDIILTQVIHTLLLAIHGPLQWPAKDANDSEHEEFKRKKLLPLWGIPVAIIISLCLAGPLEYWVGTPLRNYLRSSSNVLRFL